MDPTEQQSVLRELSDIKASLSVNTNETQNIKSSISEIKLDIREIKTDFVTRREFNEAMRVLRDESPTADFENRLRALEKFRWQLASGIAILTALADYILYKVLK